MENNIESAIAEAVAKAIQAQFGSMQLAPAESKPIDRGTKIRGIRGLASYLSCSTATAQALKNKGKIPYSEIGNRLLFYSNEVDTAIMKGGSK